MIVYMVTGSYPPDACGIGDYTYQLCIGLKPKIDLKVLYFRPTLIGMWQIICKIARSFEKPIVHLQYPALGFGKSLWPLMFFWLISLKATTIITTHEYARVHFLRKLTIFLLSIFADRIIFTNEIDQKSETKLFTRIKKKSIIIPIGSNFPRTPQKLRTLARVQLIFFGFIRPARGVEQFLACVQECRRLAPDRFEFHLLGHCLPKHEIYLNSLRENTQHIHWHISLSNQEVAALLSDMHVAYLPIPGGVSERNGSVLACLQAGLHVLAPSSAETSKSLCSIIHSVKDPNTAANLLLTSTIDWKTPPESTNRSTYLKNRDWESITEQHVSVYNSFVHRTPPKILGKRSAPL